MSRAARVRRIVTAAAYGGGGVTALGLFAYALLLGEARLAKRHIGEPAAALDADGVYGAGDGEPIQYVMLGDSLARGLGVTEVGETPAVLIAGGLSSVAGRPVRLTNVAVPGARSKDLAEQTTRALASVPAPDLALLFVGANDVTHQTRPSAAVRDLGNAVRRLREAGAAVVVGTCPDLGTVQPVAQPLKWLARRMSRQLAAVQTVSAVQAGGRTVALADLLGREFYSNPRTMFGPDHFHPSAQGYVEAAALVLPSCCAALGLWTDSEEPSDGRGETGILPIYLAAAEAVEESGAEVTAAPTSGTDAGPRGRLATLMRRRGRGAGVTKAEESGADVATKE